MPACGPIHTQNSALKGWATLVQLFMPPFLTFSTNCNWRPISLLQCPLSVTKIKSSKRCAHAASYGLLSLCHLAAEVHTCCPRGLHNWQIAEHRQSAGRSQELWWGRGYIALLSWATLRPTGQSKLAGSGSNELPLGPSLKQCNDFIVTNYLTSEVNNSQCIIYIVPLN